MKWKWKTAGTTKINRATTRPRHDLEHYCRELTKGGHVLWICCGPAGVGGEGKDGKKDEIGKGKEPDDIVLSAFGQRQNITAPPDALDLQQLSRG